VHFSKGKSCWLVSICCLFYRKTYTGVGILGEGMCTICREENVINWFTVSRLNVVNWFTVSPAGVSVPVWPRGIPSPRHTPGLKGEIKNIIMDNI